MFIPLTTYLLLAHAAAASLQPSFKTSWNCTILNSKTLHPDVFYTKQSCTTSNVPTTPDITKTIPYGPLVINIVVANLNSSDLQLVPVTALPNTVTPLDNMTNPSPLTTDLLVGINAAYFYRVDETHFFDNVCLGKLKKIALLPPSLQKPNHGVSDGAIIRNGAVLGSNCDCYGENRVTMLSINGTKTSIDVLQGKGSSLPYGLELDAIGAGPNLITNSIIAIPPHDQNFANIYEHSANTGFGLRSSDEEGRQQAVFLTTDGGDGCKNNDVTCGTNAFTLAYLMRDEFGVDAAMGMDQGGSTTMWLNGSGIVSNGGGSGRAIFSGLFLSVKKKK